MGDFHRVEPCTPVGGGTAPLFGGQTGLASAAASDDGIDSPEGAAVACSDSVAGGGGLLPFDVSLDGGDDGYGGMGMSIDEISNA
ncbi:hypothetical protein HZA86_03965 [Candidatus Uhrbacteria bacterium]|nr:hypothetical protein [Candidatus Uhrbacteria bacterium]